MLYVIFLHFTFLYQFILKKRKIEINELNIYVNRVYEKCLEDLNIRENKISKEMFHAKVKFREMRWSFILLKSHDQNC